MPPRYCATPNSSTPHRMPSTPKPSHYQRRILLSVCGLSPQVVTETLFALSQQRSPPFIPTEVHLITTTEGAQRAELALLSKDMGWFHRLCQDYALENIEFTRQHIHIVHDSSGRTLDDIRSMQDNQDAADDITALVRTFTADMGSALHVSIAGGRKTMGFYVGYALSLFGRPQDRLSHVLVSEPFESSMDFFYPTHESHVLQTRDGRLADTAQARVSLAEIPFVSLRHGLNAELLSGRASFNETVAAARAALEPPRLLIDHFNGCIIAGGVRVPLEPARLALLSVFARRLINAEPAVEAPIKDVKDPEWGKRFLKEYIASCGGSINARQATLDVLQSGLEGNYFSQTKSKLHKVLKDALGPSAMHYLISEGTSRPRKFELTLPASAVSFAK